MTRPKKVILIIALGALILGTIVHFYVDKVIEDQLSKAISDVLEKDDETPYAFSLSSVNANLWEGSITFRGLSILPKEAMLAQLASDTSSLRMLVGMQFESLSMEGFEIRKFIATRNIEVRELALMSPVFRYHFHARKSENVHAEMPLELIFNDNFKKATIGSFVIEDAQIQIIDRSSAGPELNILDFDLDVKEAYLDLETMKSFIPFTYRTIEADAEGIDIDVSKDFYIRSDELFVDVDNQSIYLDNFQINPKYDQEHFSNQYGVQKQWFAMTVDSMVVNDVAYGNFVKSAKIDIGHIDLHRPNVLLYKDKTKPPPPYQEKMLPASLLRSIGLGIEIDRIDVHNGILSIEEKFHEGVKYGTTRFEDMQVTMEGITTGRLARDTLRTQGQAKIMGQTQVELEMKFDLTSENDAFLASGHCSELNPELMNSILGPSLGLQFKQGAISELSFQFEADNDQSRGTLDMEYQQLKVNLQKPEKLDQKSNKFFLTAAANTIIRSNNVKGKKNYRQGQISRIRRKEKDVFPFLWHSVQSGIVSTLSPALEKQMTKAQQTAQPAPSP
ncbi:MAG: hypothetical protein AAGA85_24835 [Bacteroidota bacterium]